MMKSDFIEDELIFGAARREQMWRRLAYVACGFGVAGCLAAAAVAFFTQAPAPILVPFDPTTGMAMPSVKLGEISVAERDAVIESMVYKYVLDREAYNQLDNDLRVYSVLQRSKGTAAASLSEIWTSGNANYPPTKYGPSARIDVEILSIAKITNQRAQVRLIKRLRSSSGDTEGTFTAILAFEFHPEDTRKIKDVWSNPFGFVVKEYAINSDRLEK